MAKRYQEEHSIAQVIHEFIAQNKLKKGITQIQAQEAWKKIMGNGVVAYTQEVMLKDTTLYVKLTSAVLREELSYGRQKIIQILNEELQEEIIKELVLR